MTKPCVASKKPWIVPARCNRRYQSRSFSRESSWSCVAILGGHLYFRDRFLRFWVSPVSDPSRVCASEPFETIHSLASIRVRNVFFLLWPSACCNDGMYGKTLELSILNAFIINTWKCGSIGWMFMGTNLSQEKKKNYTCIYSQSFRPHYTTGWFPLEVQEAGALGPAMHRCLERRSAWTDDEWRRCHAAGPWRTVVNVFLPIRTTIV